MFDARIETLVDDALTLADGLSVEIEYDRYDDGVPAIFVHVSFRGRVLVVEDFREAREVVAWLEDEAVAQILEGVEA